MAYNIKIGGDTNNPFRSARRVGRGQSPHPIGYPLGVAPPFSLKVGEGKSPPSTLAIALCSLL